MGFQSPHRRGGSRDCGVFIARWRISSFRVSIPHRRGGSRDEAWLAGWRGQIPEGFNPLIGGADRATDKPVFRRLENRAAAFQSPHRRGGSRDRDQFYIDAAILFSFQSPHRRGGSRD